MLTWSDTFDPDGLTSRYPVPFWVAALVAAGLIGLPYVWLLAPGLPDRGAALARPVGLLLVSWLVWMSVSIELVSFTRGAIVLAALLAAAGAVAIAAVCRRELGGWLRGRWRLLAVEEGVFWSVFAGFLALRWANPDLWHPSLGGEKPMDFAFLNAVARSSDFPPYDPWFAGGEINYYYFGFVLVAVLVKATAIVPYVAYNLAIPTLAALLALSSFGVALALSAGRLLARAALVASVLAATFVTVIGNLAELEVVVDAARRDIPLDWWYWNASRAISVPAGEPGPINEFPAFTFLYADLHAHSMALPFTAAALALGLAYLRRPAGAGRGRTAGLLALLALTVGALWPLNTWDFPTYAALAAVLVLLGTRGPLRGAALAACVLAASYLLFLPFHAAYESSFSGVERWRGARTGILDFLAIHGFFLFLIATVLVVELVRRRDVRREVPALGAGLALGLAVAGHGVAAVDVAVLTLTALLFPRQPALRRAWLVLVAAGAAITLAVEYLVVSEIDIGRNNTVFKSYLQVWVLWGIAAAVGLPAVYDALRRFSAPLRLAWRGAFVCLFAAALLYPILGSRAKVDDRFDTRVGRTLDGMAFMERAVHVDRDRQLALRYDLDAIRWIHEYVRGAPVVAEVNTYPTLYGWGNRYAMFTGNPAPVGWEFHERQQRPGDGEEVVARVEAVQGAYRTTSAQRAYDLLRPFGVEYVVVGPLEHAYFPGGQAKWRTGAGRLWRLAYSNPGVQIYRVLQPGSASDPQSAPRKASQDGEATRR